MPKNPVGSEEESYADDVDRDAGEEKDSSIAEGVEVDKALVAAIQRTKRNMSRISSAFAGSGRPVYEMESYPPDILDKIEAEDKK